MAYKEYIELINSEGVSVRIRADKILLAVRASADVCIRVYSVDGTVYHMWKHLKYMVDNYGFVKLNAKQAVCKDTVIKLSYQPYDTPRLYQLRNAYVGRGTECFIDGLEKYPKLWVTPDNLRERVKHGTWKYKPRIPLGNAWASTIAKQCPPGTKIV